MIAGAGIGVDAEALAHDARAGGDGAGRGGPLARWRFNMHSLAAMITFGPFSSVVSASRKTSRIRARS